MMGRTLARLVVELVPGERVVAVDDATARHQGRFTFQSQRCWVERASQGFLPSCSAGGSGLGKPSSGTESGPLPFQPALLDVRNPE